MKRIILLLFCCVNLCCWGQDIIVTQGSQRIDAKVLEVSETEVRYKKANNLDGPVFVIAADKIASILYSNGDVQLFDKTAVQQEQPRETVVEHVVPFEPLYRDGGRIVSSKTYPYEPENMRAMLGRDAYGDYLSAQGQYGRGAACVVFGWISGITGITMAFIGAYNELPGVTVGGYLLAVTSDVLLPVGYIVRGVAAGRISRIAERYNADQNRHLSMEMGMAPTLLLAADGTATPGIGLSLRF